MTRPAGWRDRAAWGHAITRTVTVRTTASSVTAEHGPGEERDHAGERRDVEEQRGEPIGQRLGAAGATPAPRRRDAGSPPARCRHRRRRRAPGSTIGRRPCRRRLGRLRSLATGRDSPVTIDSSNSADPSTITPSAGSRPPARTSTTSPVRSSLMATVSSSPPFVDAFGLVGQQRRRAPASAELRLAERLHLLPVPEQHDRDERRQLPPEVEVEPVEARRQRRHERDGDRHRDEQHHSRLALFDLVPPTGEERPTRPDEEHRAEHRADQLHAVEVEVVAEPVHDHVAGQPPRAR